MTLLSRSLYQQYSFFFFSCFLISTLLLISTLAFTDAFCHEYRQNHLNFPIRRHIRLFASSSSSSSSSSTTATARDLLYQDQQNAMLRRALVEEEILLSTNKQGELLAPKLKIPPQKSGTGFGATNTNNNNKGKTPLERLAEAQAKVVHKEGVLRIHQALSAKTADKLREYVLEQQQIAAERTEQDIGMSKAFYGVENQRKNRCDLQLSLLRGGFAADHGGDPSLLVESESHILADSLQELLGTKGSLRYIYENLVTKKGEFYELASVITNPGSLRQQIHPDLPFQEEAPLYVIFLALQDVNENMGPTTFLLRTHTKKQNEMFNDPSQKDEQLQKANSRIATLHKGDAVLFDARILHCGNANDLETGSTRALFNFSFRNPKVSNSLGYEGSIRPGYCGAMNLGDISEILLEYEGGKNKDPFAKYLDGLPRR